MTRERNALVYVWFDHLPEQIREHERYLGVNVFKGVWLSAEQAVVEFYPAGDCGPIDRDEWAKSKDGWVLVRTS
jgi:hypothetical protein